MPLRYCFLGYVFLYFFRNRNNENIFVWIVLNNLFFRTKKNISFNFTINRNKRKNTKWPQSFRTLFNSLDSEVWTDRLDPVSPVNKSNQSTEEEEDKWALKMPDMVSNIVQKEM